MNPPNDYKVKKIWPPPYVEETVTFDDIHIGDIVEVTKKVPSQDKGWRAAWVKGMDSCVGHKYVVNNKRRDDGVLLSCGWWFPYHALRLVEFME